METAAAVVFLSAAGFLIYSLVGYPLLVFGLARLFPRPVAKRFEPRAVSVLVPVHNGETWIRQKLESILALDYPKNLMEVLVLSDGSTDKTEAITAAFGEGVRVLRLPKGGKAQAVNKGVEAATGEILFFTDVRQRLNPECLTALVENFADPHVGAVCGELIILDGRTQEENSVGLYWKVEKWIRRQLSDMGTLLVLTGCVYAIRKELADPLPPDVLGDDIYMPQSVLRKGYRVVFEERAKAFDYPTDRDVEFRRKVRTLAGLYQYLRQHGFGAYPFQFFSYKVSRLLLPHALIAIAVSTPFLPFPLALAAGAAQVFVYGIAAADSYLPEGSILRRISAPSRTFCMMMAASLASASVLFRPAHSLWSTTQVRAPKIESSR